jgi:hypothetical protein
MFLLRLWPMQRCVTCKDIVEWVLQGEQPIATAKLAEVHRMQAYAGCDVVGGVQCAWLCNV